MYTADSFEHDGIPVRVVYDENASNPYDVYDQASRLLVSPALARDFEFGETFHRMEYASSLAVARRFLTLMEGYPVAIPFVLRDYGSGGLRVFLVDTDSDRASGFLVMDAETVRQEWGENVDAAERLARAEFEDFARYVAGDVYGVIVAEGTPEEDACWGFFGMESAEEYGREMAEDVAPVQRERLARERHYRFDPSTLVPA